MNPSNGFESRTGKKRSVGQKKQSEKPSIEQPRSTPSKKEPGYLDSDGELQTVAFGEEITGSPSQAFRRTFPPSAAMMNGAQGAVMGEMSGGQSPNGNRPASGPLQHRRERSSTPAATSNGRSNSRSRVAGADQTARPPGGAQTTQSPFFLSQQKTPNHNSPTLAARPPKASPAHPAPINSWKGRTENGQLRLGVPNGANGAITSQNLFPTLDSMPKKSSDQSWLPSLEDSGNSIPADGMFKPGMQSSPLWCPVAGVSLLKGRRPYMEDEHRVVMRLESLEGCSCPNQTTYFFGLFDGHAGGRCSKAISQLLPGLVAKEPDLDTNMSSAIQKGFAKTNQEWLKRADRYNMNDGSTCITAFVRGSLLIVANVGDSRAVLGCDGKALAMSRDHKPNRPEERRRIAAAGGHVVVSLGVHRVNGVLAVSRAFGDKNMRPAIKADPELKEKMLEPGDNFLILGTDGLWDMVTNQEAVNVVARGLDDLGPQGCAEMLTTISIRRGSMDNTSAMVVDLRPLSDPSRNDLAPRLPPTDSSGNLRSIPNSPRQGDTPTSSPTKAAMSPQPTSGYRYARNA